MESRKLDEMFDAVFGKATKALEEVEAIRAKKEPKMADLSALKKEFEEMNKSERLFATTLVRDDKYMDAVYDLLKVMNEVGAAQEIIKKVTGDEIDVEKVINVTIKNITDIKDFDFGMEVKRR